MFCKEIFNKTSLGFIFLKAFKLVFPYSSMELIEEVKQLIEAFPFSLTFWERRGDKLYSLYRNAASEKLLGFRAKDFIGKEYYACYPHAPLSYKERFNRVLDKGETWIVEEFRFVGKAGQKQKSFRFTSFRVDEHTVGVIIEPVRMCRKMNHDGTPCPNMAVLGNFCMKHALQQLGKKAL